MEFHSAVFDKLLMKAIKAQVVSLEYGRDRAKLVVKALGVKITIATIFTAEIRESNLTAVS